MRRLQTRRAMLIASLVITALTVDSAPAAAARPPCQAYNTSPAAPPTDLTSALAAAAPGDTIAVAGYCQGSWTLTKNISLVRRSALSIATLNGDQTNPVLTVSTGVTATIRGLAVEHGTPGVLVQGTATLTGNTVIRDNSGTNGGVFVNTATLHVTGQTLITQNSAGFFGGGDGGGIHAFHSTVTVNGQARIIGNHAPINGDGGGGGIAAAGGTLTVGGYAQVNGNDAVSGGGIALSGTIHAAINGHAQVDSNKLIPNTGGGGGIWLDDQTATLRVADYAQIDANTAGEGGGIVNIRGTTTVAGNAQVDGNQANDPIAEGGGGGILSTGGVVILQGSAQVDRNSSLTRGGGVFGWFGATIRIAGVAQVINNTAATTGGGVGLDDVESDTLIGCASWTGVISPNTPDDPPFLTPGPNC
jgi:hypothetical protein